MALTQAERKAAERARRRERGEKQVWISASTLEVFDRIRDLEFEYSDLTDDEMENKYGQIMPRWVSYLSKRQILEEALYNRVVFDFSLDEPCDD